MREFPNVTIPGLDFSIFLWLLIPVGGAVLFYFLEFAIEHFTEKRYGHPKVGIGYWLMGVSLLTAVLAVPSFIDEMETQRARAAAIQLEQIGFEEVRLTLASGTFGAYYNGDLMRGALVPIQNHPGEYRVIETPPPS